MSCNREKQYLLYFWGEMDVDQARDFTEHLDKCPACQARLARLEPLLQAMREIQPQPLDAELASRINDRLAKAAQPHQPKFLLKPRRLLAAAASIVLLLAASIVFQNLLGPQQRPSDGVAGITGEEVFIIQGDEDDQLALAIIDELATMDADDFMSAQINNVADKIDALWEDIKSDFNPNGSSEDGQSSWKQHTPIAVAIYTGQGKTAGLRLHEVFQMCEFVPVFLPERTVLS